MTTGRGQVDQLAADVMVTIPKTHPDDTTIATVRAVFENPHVHMVLLIRNGHLLGTVTRTDVPYDLPGSASALAVSTLADRTVRADEPATTVRELMDTGGLRRLAVTDGAGRVLGLVCLKRDRSGFCTDRGVAARAAERSCQ